ncbi:hypothetical protein D7X33_35090, partial [Butyricicoccus sp. 1XD8-22]
MKFRNWKKSLKVLLSASLVASLVVPTTIPLSVVHAASTDLIISEYIEGSGDNKALEIYNGTGSSVDLSSYKLELYSNGASTPSNSLGLKGTLENGETYLIVKDHSNTSIELKGVADLLNSTVINFNGDDAIVLKKSEEVIDSFGQVGKDPGTAWSANGVTTIDKTLVRKSTITTGDINPSDDFDPSQEWVQFYKDTFTYFGSHEMDGGDVTPPVENEVKLVAATPAEGVVKAGTTITLSTETEGATIYYTIDGTEPTTSSDVYSEPIVINENTTIKAFAVADDLESSEISTFEYKTLTTKSISEVRTSAIGDIVSTTGTVTAVIGKTTFIQNDNAGIVLYGENLGVELGEIVRATGELAEFRGLLEINVTSADIEVLDSVTV